jgi:hypothetical protein
MPYVPRAKNGEKMKSVFLLLAVFLCSNAFASDPPVWNRPTTNITVGSVAYFDCQTPSTFTGTAAYMKLWVGGTAVALNHQLNRLGAAIPMPPGTYSVVCQYSIDGVSGINSATLSITYGDSTKDRLNLENSAWSQTAGCSGSTCGSIADATNSLDSNANDTQSGSGSSRAFSGSKDASFSFEDEDWFQKRLENVSLPGAWIYDFWVRQSAVPRGLEWGISHCSSSAVKYRMAFQANYAATPNPIWRYFTPTRTDPKGSGGSWTDTTFQAENFTGAATDPNHGFTHVYFIGHPSSDASGATVVIDAIQIGEGMGSLPGNAAQILGVSVPAYTATTSNCTSGTGQWNLQSTQIDLDGTHTGDTMWLADVGLHFQP